jgi:hypothetical protein
VRIDLDWSDGAGRSWRTIWDSAGTELARIECTNGGYRWTIGDEWAGPWMDRLYDATAGATGLPWGLLGGATVGFMVPFMHG